MKLKIGVTGTRHGATKKQIAALEDLILRQTGFELHHGCCVGADDQSVSLANMCRFRADKKFADGIKIVGYPPIITTYKSLTAIRLSDHTFPAKSYLARNRDIVVACDVLVGMPRTVKSEKQDLNSGTWYTIKAARKLKLPTMVVYPDGETEYYSAVDSY